MTNLLEQLKLLQMYNTALEKENNSKNIERKELYGEIQRLNKIIGQKIITKSYTDNQNMNQKISHQKLRELQFMNNELKSQNINLKNQIQSFKMKDQITTKNIQNQEVIEELFNQIRGLKNKLALSQRQQLHLQQAFKKIQFNDSAQVEILQKQLVLKNDECNLKDKSLIKLRSELEKYTHKITLMEQQFQGIKKYSNNQQINKSKQEILQIQIVNCKKIITDLNLLLENSRNQNFQLNQKFKSRNRRVMILEDANNNLQTQLINAIKNRQIESQRKIKQYQDSHHEKNKYFVKQKIENIEDYEHNKKKKNFSKIEKKDFNKVKNPNITFRTITPTNMKSMIPSSPTYDTRQFYSYSYLPKSKSKKNISKNIAQSNYQQWQLLQKRIEVLKKQNSKLKGTLYNSKKLT